MNLKHCGYFLSPRMYDSIYFKENAIKFYSLPRFAYLNPLNLIRGLEWAPGPHAVTLMSPSSDAHARHTL